MALPSGQVFYTRPLPSPDVHLRLCAPAHGVAEMQVWAHLPRTTRLRHRQAAQEPMPQSIPTPFRVLV